MPDEIPAGEPAAEPAGEQNMTGAEGTINVDGTVERLAASLFQNEQPEGGDPKPEGEPTTEKEPVETKPEGEPKEPVAAAPVEKDDFPATWKPEVKEAWKTVDPTLKAEILRREADINRLATDLGENAKSGKAFVQVVTPYLGLFKQHNINPWNHVAGLLQGHTAILMGPMEERIGRLRALANDAGVDLRTLAGIPADPNAPAPAPMDPAAQARFQRLEQELAQAKGALTGVTTTIQEQRTQELAGSVLQFMQDPAHPYFDEVAEDIVTLINAKAARTLEEAYNLAIGRNPVTRAKITETELARRAKTESDARAAKIAKVKSASGANVVSRTTGRPGAPDESLDDTLKSTLAAIHARN